MALASKIATARRLSPETMSNSLGTLLELGPVRGNEMLGVFDWLLKRQRWIERSLANRHLKGATLILYDIIGTRTRHAGSPAARRSACPSTSGRHGTRYPAGPGT